MREVDRDTYEGGRQGPTRKVLREHEYNLNLENFDDLGKYI